MGQWNDAEGITSRVRKRRHRRGDAAPVRTVHDPLHGRARREGAPPE